MHHRETETRRRLASLTTVASVAGALLLCPMLTGCCTRVFSEPTGARVHHILPNGTVGPAEGALTPFAVGVPPKGWYYVEWPDGTVSEKRRKDRLMFFVKPGAEDLTRTGPSGPSHIDTADASPGEAPEAALAAEGDARRAKDPAARDRAERQRLEKKLAELKARGGDTRAEQERLRKELDGLRARQGERGPQASSPG